MVSINVLHVVPTFYPATYWGGPIFSVMNLCNVVALDKAISLKVLTTDSRSPNIKDRLNLSHNPVAFVAGIDSGARYDVYYCRRQFGHSGSFPLLWQLLKLASNADVVHLTAVYSWPTIPTLLTCRILGIPIVWSPRGALQRWDKSRRRILKFIWEKLCMLLINRARTIVHVTSEAEKLESDNKLGNLESVVVPNGIEIPEHLPDRAWCPSGILRILYLGRLDRKKGIENLLHAVSLLSNTQVFVQICGEGERSYTAELKALANTLHLPGVVAFTGQVDGPEKLQAFIASDICILPSFTENFGMVVAEALAHGVPVIASKFTPWEGLVTNVCGLWVDNTPASLAHAIEDMKERNLAEMGARGRNWMRRAFDIKATGRQVTFMYKNLIAKNNGRRNDS